MQWANFFHIYQPPAWDEDIVRRAADQAYRPLIDILRRHTAVTITLNISASLTEQLVAHGLHDVLDGLRQLVERGQIELVGSAAYHPILPLLPVEEIIRQIDLQDEWQRKVFGKLYQPKGFFPPEMAFGKPLERVLIDRGYDWVVLDEPAATGTVGRLNFDKKYRTPGGLGVIFRNRHISDFLSFSAVIEHPEVSIKALQEDKRSQHHLVTAMDGENLGHHRAGVDRLWELLVSWPDVRAVSLSHDRQSLSSESVVDVLASSWSSQPAELKKNIPYGLWDHPDNPLHKLQWELTYLVIETVRRNESDPAYDTARRLLDRALTSDKYWWASASPWWDAAIVIRETQKLADVVAPLEGVRPAIKNHVERLMKQVASTAELWDSTGLAKQRQANYLRQTGAVHFMGGQQVTGRA